MVRLQNGLPSPVCSCRGCHVPRGCLPTRVFKGWEFHLNNDSLTFSIPSNHSGFSPQPLQRLTGIRWVIRVMLEDVGERFDVRVEVVVDFEVAAEGAFGGPVIIEIEGLRRGASRGRGDRTCEFQSIRKRKRRQAAGILCSRCPNNNGRLSSHLRITHPLPSSSDSPFPNCRLVR